MIVPAEVTRAAAKAMEQRAHRDGWDLPPQLLSVQGRKFGGNVLLEIKEVPFRTVIPSGNPAVYLRFMADHFGEDHVLSQGAEFLATHDFIGLALVNEAWARTGMTEEEIRGDGPRRKFADMPGSIEIRCVTIVDTSGRIAFCERRRGKKPTVSITGEGAGGDGDEGFRAGGGRVPAALRDMVLATALRMPFGTADLNALRSITLTAERG